MWTIQWRGPYQRGKLLKGKTSLKGWGHKGENQSKKRFKRKNFSTIILLSKGQNYLASTQNAAVGNRPRHALKEGYWGWDLRVPAEKAEEV